MSQSKLYQASTINSSPRKLVQNHLAAMEYEQLRSSERNVELTLKIEESLAQNDAVLIAHYYTDPEIQALAEKTGGIVSDSLDMAKFGATHKAKNLIVAGVHFMGETAKILTPEKEVFMPSTDATCSLDIGCPPDQFSAFCDQHPDRTIVVYANTSAAVKARADWVVTSSIALDVISYLDSLGEKILWAPDKYLGSYVQKNTGADMVIWDGSCIVHEEFKAKGILDLKNVYPDAAVLVHPESPESVIEIADHVGSTSQIIKAATELPNSSFIVATDQGIFYKLNQLIPDKHFYIAPTAGSGATCRSCANCPWMAMNNLENLLACIESKDNEIIIDHQIASQAKVSLDRMLNFKK